MFHRKPRNIKTHNLPTVRCRDKFSIVLWIVTTLLKRILPAAMLPFLCRRDVLWLVFFHSTPMHVERMKPVLGSRSSSFSQMPVASIQENFSVSSTAVSKVAFLQAAVNLSKQKVLFVRPAQPGVRRPRMWRKWFALKMSRSLPRVILPPFLKPTIRSTFESPRMSPYDASHRENNSEFK